MRPDKRTRNKRTMQYSNAIAIQTPNASLSKHGSNLLELLRQKDAWPAPGGEKIDNHRAVTGPNLGFELLRGQLVDLRNG